MSARKNPSVFSDVVRITHVYLGPAADRFIIRQVENHLHKPTQELTNEDLLSLMDWIRAVVGLITEDADIVEEYINELTRLAQGSSDQKSKP